MKDLLYNSNNNKSSFAFLFNSYIFLITLILALFSAIFVLSSIDSKLLFEGHTEQILYSALLILMALFLCISVALMFNKRPNWNKIHFSSQHDLYDFCINNNINIYILDSIISEFDDYYNKKYKLGIMYYKYFLSSLLIFPTLCSTLAYKSLSFNRYYSLLPMSSVLFIMAFALLIMGVFIVFSIGENIKIICIEKFGKNNLSPNFKKVLTNTKYKMMGVK